MNFNSSGYFAYKKNKIQREIETTKKPISRLNFLFQLFLATFIIVFIVIIVCIMKYSSKIDIEYAQGELQLSSGAINSIPNYGKLSEEEPQRRIDKRLMLIQQEENAPSEARIVEKKNIHQEVIASAHLENNKKIEKLEKQKKMSEQNEDKNSKITSIIEEVKMQKRIPAEQFDAEKNITVMSKVLIGRYATLSCS